MTSTQRPHCSALSALGPLGDLCDPTYLGHFESLGGFSRFLFGFCWSPLLLVITPNGPRLGEAGADVISPGARRSILSVEGRETLACPHLRPEGPSEKTAQQAPNQMQSYLHPLVGRDDPRP